jgi:rod shape-determining protein MreD
MNRIIIRNAVRFLLLIPLQVLVFNNIAIHSYLIPHIYLLFILLLPFETPKWLLLLVSFTMGIFIDVFSFTIGLHATACTFIAFLRPTILNLVGSKQEYVPGMQPGVGTFGLRWFFTYTLIMVSIHHVIVYFLEVFSFREILITLFQAILNVLFTTTAIVLTHLVFFRPAKTKEQ